MTVGDGVDRATISAAAGAPVRGMALATTAGGTTVGGGELTDGRADDITGTFATGVAAAPCTEIGADGIAAT